MIVVAHRKNTIRELVETDSQFGVEIDIRSSDEEIYLQHDPFVPGEKLNLWLPHYRHKLLILNVKEEGLENRITAMMKDFGVENYFFLDQSFPFLIKYSNQGERRCAVRISEYESIETALTLAGKIDWIWIDYFSKFPLCKEQLCELQTKNFKLCIVSPELQGYDADKDVISLKTHLQQEGIVVDAVCTKKPHLWQEHSAR